MNFATKNKLGIVLVAIAAFLFWVLIFATYQSIGPYRQAIDEREQLVEERRRVLNHIQKINDEYHEYLSDFEQLSLSVPLEKHLDEVVIAIDAMAVSSGIQIAGLQVTEDKFQKKNQKFDLLKMNLEVTGDYNALKQFLGLLEQNVRLMDTNLLEVSVPKVGGNTNLLAIKLMASIYFIE